MKKRLLSLVLTLAMVLSFVPGMTVTANAESVQASSVKVDFDTSELPAIVEGKTVGEVFQQDPPLQASVYIDGEATDVPAVVFLAVKATEDNIFNTSGASGVYGELEDINRILGSNYSSDEYDAIIEGLNNYMLIAGSAKVDSSWAHFEGGLNEEYVLRENDTIGVVVMINSEFDANCKFALNDGVPATSEYGAVGGGFVAKIFYQELGTVGAAPAEVPHSNHCVCVADGCDNHDPNTEWEAWSTKDALPTEGNKHYYLTEDVTLSGAWEVPANVALCLNGHVVRTGGNCISVMAGDFTLTDCNTEAEHKFRVKENGLWQRDELSGTETVYGGVITGGTRGVYINNANAAFDMYGGSIVGNNRESNNGGGIEVRQGTATIYNGAIIGNLAGQGGGIYGSSSATINVYGGLISENTATSTGGGIYSNAYMYREPVCHVKGAPVIDNNKASGVENNVNLVAPSGGEEGVAYSSSTPVIEIDGLVIDGAYIGVTADAGASFTTHWTDSDNGGDDDDPNQYFFSDRPGYIVATEGVELKLTGTGAPVAVGRIDGGVDYDSTFGALTPGKSLPKLSTASRDDVEGLYDVEIVLKKAGDSDSVITTNVTAEWQIATMSGDEPVFTPATGPVVANQTYLIKITITGAFNAPNASDVRPNVGDMSAGIACIENLSVLDTAGEIVLYVGEVSGGGTGGGTGYNVTLVQNLNNGSAKVELFDAAYEPSGVLGENGIYEGSGKYAGVMITGEDLDRSKITVKANGVPVAFAYSDEEGALHYESITLEQDTVITVSDGGSSNNNNNDSSNDNNSDARPAARPSGSSIGGGSSSGSGTITVPVSNDKNEVKVEAAVSGNDATIKPMDKQQIEQIVGDSKAAGDVVVDLTELGKEVDTAGIPKVSLEAIVDAAEDAKNDTAHLVIKLSTAELKLDDTAMRAIVDQAKGDLIEFNFDDVGLTRMNGKQKAAVKGMDIRKGYEAYITVNGQRIGDFKGGEVEITVPYEIPAGENKAGFSVWYIDENGKPEKQKSTYDGKEKCFVVTHFSDYVIVYNKDDAQAGSYMVCTKDANCPIHGYADASASAWYHDGVHYCIEHGIMNGYSSTSFKPNGAVTRQQVWMTLARLSGEKPANSAETRAWAMANGVSDGTNPTSAVTRQQFITMLYRYAVDKGYDVSVGEETNILSYADAFSVSEYAIPAMQWGCGSGIMGGYGDGTLKPTDGATRAHLAAFLQRFCVNA